MITITPEDDLMSPRATAPRFAALAALAMLIAACGNSAATAAPGTQATATQSTPTAAPASLGAGATGGPSVDPLASFHGAQDLEALLPDTIGGTKVAKASVSGTDFMSTMGGSDELKAALTALGKTPADLKVAFGGAGTGTIFAFQVKDVPGSQILTALFAANPGAAVTDVNYGGKAVKKVVASGETSASYVYSARDVAFVTAGTDIGEATLNDMFSQLP